MMEVWKWTSSFLLPPTFGLTVLFKESFFAERRGEETMSGRKGFCLSFCSALGKVTLQTD